MCFDNSGAKAAEAEARRAREQEDARQREIRDGRQNVNAIFDGGVYGAVDAKSELDPNKTYYRADGSVYEHQAPAAAPPDSDPAKALPGPQTPQDKMQSLLGRGDPAPAPPDGDAKRNPLAGLLGGMRLGAPGGPEREQLFSEKRDGFATDDFFARNRQSFMDYALPQLDKQFGNASNELSFDLARSGLLNSSTRGSQTGKLQELYDQNMQQVTNEALSREQQQRNAVEDSRANLISLLQTTGDAQGATNQALSRASILSQPQPFSPIGQMFGDFTAGLGTQAAMERAGSVSAGRYQPRYNTGLFGTPNNAVMNRR